MDDGNVYFLVGPVLPVCNTHCRTLKCSISVVWVVRRMRVCVHAYALVCVCVCVCVPHFIVIAFHICFGAIVRMHVQNCSDYSIGLFIAVGRRLACWLILIVPSFPNQNKTREEKTRAIQPRAYICNIFGITLQIYYRIASRLHT